MSNFEPHSMPIYGKPGEGYYSTHTKGQARIIKLATPLIMESVKNIDLGPKEPFVICDYGTADGGATMGLMSKIIEFTKKRYGSEKEIHIIYEDQATNDFNSLFSRVHDLIEADERSFFGSANNLYVSATATNFFQQCLPKEHVNLGVSFTAMHYLSKRPVKLSQSCIVMETLTPDEETAFSKQAAEDWETILIQRAKELKPGGYLMIACPSTDETGAIRETGTTTYSAVRTLTKHWKQMRNEGLITHEEYEETNFNLYLRTLDEFTAPFQDPESTLSKSGLCVLSMESKYCACIYHEQLKSSKSETDSEGALAHAKRLSNNLRIWSYAFKTALVKSRMEEEKELIVSKLFTRFEAEVEREPHKHALDFMHTYMQIKKVDVKRT